MKGSSTLLALPLALALLLGGAAHAADGIESRPLQFAKGASSATVKGSIAGRQTIDYKLRARAGQTMSVTLKSGNPGLAFNVLPPGSQDVAIEGAIAQQNWSGTLPADGEYTVRTYLDRAGARRGEKASYTLTVAIDAAAAQSGGKESAALAATGRAAEGKFNATGPLACARAKGQPMGQCEMGTRTAASASSSSRRARPSAPTSARPTAT